MKNKLFLIFFLIFSGSLFCQWINQPAPTGFNIFSCSFPSASSGFAVGYGNLILKTTNGGQSWINKSFPGTAPNLNSVWFINENTGWISSTNDTLYKTTNNGISWSPSFYLQGPGDRIFFVNQSTGWVMGYLKLFRTTNSGASWNLINTNTGNDIFFINENTGWMSTTAAGSSTIYKTTNGGVNWSPQYSTSDFRIIYSFFFVDANTGWASGYREHILKTTNSGVNWVQQRDMNNGIGLHSIVFMNLNTGWAVGDNGEALSTTNGGDILNLTTLQGSTFAEVEFINQSTGWIVGNFGKIYKTTNLGGITFINPVSNEIPRHFSLFQNYPNPFNPSTKIRFEIPNVEAARRVAITVFDILGREIAVLVNEQLKPGTYEAEWDGTNYPSGVYYYKLTSGDFTGVKKMTLVK